MPAVDLVPRRYVPKESVPPLGLVVTLLVVLLAVSVLASIYAVASFYVPFVNMLTLLAAPALGAGAAMFSQWALEAGRIRSPAVGLAITVLAAVLALHVSWVVWIAVLGRDSALLQLAFRPLALARAIALVNQSGAREIGGWMPTGFVLGLLWSIEAALIVGPGIVFGRDAGRELYERPFCERCRSWLGHTETIACLELGEDDPPQLRSSIMAGDWSALRERPSTDDDDQALRITLGSCKCGELNVLAVERHTIQDGRYDCVVIAKDLLVDASLVRTLGRSSQPE